MTYEPEQKKDEVVLIYILRFGEIVTCPRIHNSNWEIQDFYSEFSHNNLIFCLTNRGPLKTQSVFLDSTCMHLLFISSCKTPKKKIYRVKKKNLLHNTIFNSLKTSLSLKLDCFCNGLQQNLPSFHALRWPPPTWTLNLVI